jgi:UDP-glucose 4-epimerase
MIGITGADGFIGNHLYQSLSDSFECEKFDKNKYNLLSSESMRDFVSNKNTIFHLAAKNRSSNMDLVNVNTFGTLNLLESIRKYSENDPKLIFVSSLQVYGFQKEIICFKENSQLNPTNFYGLSKSIAENIINYYFENYGIKSIILRLANVYGPGCKPYYNSVISTFIDKIKKDEKVIINGTGEQTRDYIFITDVIDSLFKALRYKSDKVEEFNICTGIPTSLKHIISILNDIVGQEVDVEFVTNNFEVDHLIGDPSKTKKYLKFNANTELNEGLHKIFNYY